MFRPMTAMNNKKLERGISPKMPDINRGRLGTAKPRNPFEGLGKSANDNIDNNDLDLIFLIMKNSPQKYDLDKVNYKFKTLNQHFSHKLFDNRMDKVDSTFYKYNLLYGTNAVNLIKSYSQKMRPDSSAIRNRLPTKSKYDNFESNCFSAEEMKIIFLAKCVDLNIKSKDNLERKFYDYCAKKCINRRVDFSECNLSINSSEALSFVVSQNDKIARLNLSKNSLGDRGIELLIKGLESNKSVVHLDISSNDLTAKGGNLIFDFMINNDSIVSLNISSKEGLHRNRLTAEGITSLESVLRENKFLEFLDISGNSLKNEGLKIISRGLDNNKTLYYLNVSNNEITAKGIKYISRIPISKLVHIVLSENPLGNDGITYLADCLNKPVFNSLRKLEINSCKFDILGFRKLFENLQGNKRLEYLYCNKNNLKTKENEFEVIKPAFSNLYLKELSMIYCKLGNKAAKIIAEGIQGNNTITSLNLSDNNIDDRGFNYFVELPIKNNTLQKLDVSKNQISDFSANPFVKNLLKNRHLTDINFFDNQLKNETGTSLIEVLRQNINIQKIGLKFNGVQTRTIEEIERQLKNNQEILKHKKLPNLRKEIRSTYITDQDFENVDLKIKETALNYETLSEKLKEEVERFEKLKHEEIQRLKLIDTESEDFHKCLITQEEELKKLNRELLIEKEYHAKQIDKYNEDMGGLNSEIEQLNQQMRDLKKEIDKKNILWKDDLKKITSENVSSYNALKSTQKGYESLKKDLDQKQLLIKEAEEKAKKIEEEDLNHKSSELNISRSKGKRSTTKLRVTKKESVILLSEESKKKFKDDENKKARAKTTGKYKGKNKGKSKDKGKSNKEISETNTEEITDTKSENIVSLSNKNINEVKSKIDTKPKSKLKPRKKYDIKKPNV